MHTGREREGMTERLKGRAQTLLTLNIVPLRGAGAEGPSAVSCNRTSLFVSARGSLRAINGTQYPLCMEVVSVSLETDKHIIHKCQTVCVQRDAPTGGERDFGIAVQQSFPCSADNINDFTRREECGEHIETCGACCWYHREEGSNWGAAWQTLSCIIVLNGDLSKEKYSWGRSLAKIRRAGTSLLFTSSGLGPKVQEKEIHHIQLKFFFHHY